MRNNSIDNLRGIAFIFMIIHHIFYLYDVTNNYKTNYSSNILIETSGNIARTLFIFLIGVSLSLTSKDKSIKKRLKRSFTIAMHALFISFVTYMYYPYKFIKFVVLNFIELESLLG